MGASARRSVDPIVGASVVGLVGFLVGIELIGRIVGVLEAKIAVGD